MQINHLLATEYVRMHEREFGTREWHHLAAARALRKERTRAKTWRSRRPVRWFARVAAAENQVS